MTYPELENKEEETKTIKLQTEQTVYRIPFVYIQFCFFYPVIGFKGELGK